MDITNFYKEIHFKEIDRKHTLNNSFQFPVIILTTLITINIFLAKQNYDECLFMVLKILLFINLIAFILCLFYLLKSYNNLFQNHNYKELSLPTELYTFENELANAKRDDEFEPYLKKLLCEISEHNFIINKDRTEQLATAKTYLFLCIVLTMISSIIFLISIL